MLGNRAALVLALFAVFCVGTHQATIDYCEVLEKSLLFYEAQRSGRLPATNRIPWRGNSALKDCTATNCQYDANGDGNLAGGYYDAGDGVKFGLPGAWSLTVLAWGLIEFKAAVVSCGQYDEYLDALKWGLDWWIKAHPSANVLWGQVGNGGSDHAFWGPPETMTMSRPAYDLGPNKGGTELAMEVASAFAAGAIAFAAAGKTDYADTLETHATQLWDFGITYQTSYTSSIPDAGSYYASWSGFTDEIVWGSAWLYRLTGAQKYLSKAQQEYSAMPGKANANSFDWDNKAPGAIVLLAKLTNNAAYISDANSWLNWWKPGGVSYTPGGLAWIRQWGPARYAANSAFLGAIMSGPSSANTWVQGQINYMLGVNPQSQSFVVGYGPNYPRNPHHRAAHGSTSNDINNPSQNKYLLVGALVGGPSQSDGYSDNRNDYISNEVALDYNAGFTGAVAALAHWFPNGYTSGPVPVTTASNSGSGSGSGTCGAGTPAESGCNGIKITLNEAVNAQWIAIQNPVRGVGAAVSTLEIKDSGSFQNYQTMSYQSWGAWSFTGPQLTPPFSLRVNLCNGVQHTFNNLITSLTGGATFCGIPSSGTTGAATSTSTSTTAKPTTSTSTTTAKATTSTTTGSTSTTAKATTGSTSTTAKATTGSTSTTAKATTGSTSTTAKSTSSTTGGSTTGSSSNANVAVYTDSLQNGFQDWSWVTRDLSYSTNARTGSKTISLTISQNWGALYLNKAAGIDTDKVKGLEFWIRRAASGSGQPLKVNVLKNVDGSATPFGNAYVIDSSFVTTTYKRVFVDFDAQNVPTGKYDGFWIQDNAGATQSAVLIDDITLIGR